MTISQHLAELKVIPKLQPVIAFKKLKKPYLITRKSKPVHLMVMIRHTAYHVR